MSNIVSGEDFVNAMKQTCGNNKTAPTRIYHILERDNYISNDHIDLDDIKFIPDETLLQMRDFGNASLLIMRRAISLLEGDNSVLNEVRERDYIYTIIHMTNTTYCFRMSRTTSDRFITWLLQDPNSPDKNLIESNHFVITYESEDNAIFFRDKIVMVEKFENQENYVQRLNDLNIGR